MSGSETKGTLSLARRAAAEGLGTALLLATVVGSGVMGERLSGGNVALALLANTVATGAALVALILAFGAVSGAHFNPAVTLSDAWRRGLAWRGVPAYLSAQLAGALAATLLFRWLVPSSPEVAGEVVVPHANVAEMAGHERAVGEGEAVEREGSPASRR